jgi:O-antigen/teichoic acid export membrane protein
VTRSVRAELFLENHCPSGRDKGRRGDIGSSLALNPDWSFSGVHSVAASRPMFGSRLSQRLARNSSFTLLGRAWYVILWFLVTPIVLHELGVERFGVWSLLFLLSGYLATFDLGLGASVVKYTAEHMASADWDGLRDTLAAVFRAYLVLGVVWVAAIFLIHPYILKWLHIPVADMKEVRFALLASCVVFAFANLVSVGLGVLNGMQRMDLSNGIIVFGSIPQFTILLLGLRAGYGLYAVVASTLGQWFFVGLATWVLLRKFAPRLKWPSLRGSGRSTSWFGFSIMMQANNVLELSQQQVDKILLAAWVGLRSVAEFELGFRVANGIQSLPILVLNPLLPAFATLHAGKEPDRFRRLWKRGTNLLAAGALGLGACCIPEVPLLLRAWVGSDYPAAEVIAQWLLAGFAINLSTGVATAAARGAGRPSLEILPSVIAVPIHIALSRILVTQFGTVGIGPAFCLSTVIWTGVFFLRFARWTRVSLREILLPAFARPLAASVPAILIGWWSTRLLPPTWLSGRMGIVMGAGLCSFASFLVFWGVWLSVGWVAARLHRISPSDGTPCEIFTGDPDRQ